MDNSQLAQASSVDARDEAMASFSLSPEAVQSVVEGLLAGTQAVMVDGLDLSQATPAALKQALDGLRRAEALVDRAIARQEPPTDKFRVPRPDDVETKVFRPVPGVRRPAAGQHSAISSHVPRPYGGPLSGIVSPPSTVAMPAPGSYQPPTLQSPPVRRDW